jgi:hypothetical protein
LNSYEISKIRRGYEKQLTILFLAIMTVCFSFNTVLGIDLYPVVDSHMNVWEDTPLPVNFMAGIRLSDGMWDLCGSAPVCIPTHIYDIGIIEFDISELNSLFNPDDICTNNL